MNIFEYKFPAVLHILLLPYYIHTREEGGLYSCRRFGGQLFPWAGTGYAGWMVLFPKGGIDLGRGGAYIQTMAFFLQGIVKILNLSVYFFVFILHSHPTHGFA